MNDAERQRAIIAQNAGTTAAQLLDVIVKHDISDEAIPALLDTFDLVREHVFTGSLEAAAVAAVVETFPGAVPVPGVPSAVAAAAAAAPELAQPATIIPHPSTQQPPPVPPPAPSTQQYGGSANCPKCNGPTYDNRSDNARRRAGGYKLGPDFKCKNRSCGGVVWPADFQTHKNNPPEPR